MNAGRAMKPNGFTLIELLVTILLVAVLSAMTLPLFFSGVTRSSDPLNQMPTPLSLQDIMARIIADYYSNATSYLHDLNQLNANITTGNYGITAGHTITKDPAYKFDPSDIDTALKVTIRDNATGQTMTFVFTKQL